MILLLDAQFSFSPGSLVESFWLRKVVKKEISDFSTGKYMRQEVKKGSQMTKERLL